jgi:hypothetical protein
MSADARRATVLSVVSRMESRGCGKEGVQMRRSSGIVTAGALALALAGSLILSGWAAQAGSGQQGATDTSYEQVELTRSQIGR